MNKDEFNIELKALSNPFSVSSFFKKHKISRLSEDQLFDLLLKLSEENTSWKYIEPFIGLVRDELNYKRQLLFAKRTRIISWVAVGASAISTLISFVNS